MCHEYGDEEQDGEQKEDDNADTVDVFADSRDEGQDEDQEELNVRIADVRQG